MKSLLFAALFAVSLPVSAQEMPGCFMVDSYGRAISLNSLCTASGGATPQQDLKPTAYAYAYCQSVDDGLTKDVARRKAVEALTEMNQIQGGGAVGEDVLRQAIEAAENKCPDDF